MLPSPTTPQFEDFTARVKGGESMDDIAADYGVSRQAVHGFLKRHAPATLTARKADRRARLDVRDYLRDLKTHSLGAYNRQNTLLNNITQVLPPTHLSDGDNCWLFGGCQVEVMPGHIYGRFSWKGGPEYAHRVSWMLAHGVDEIPEDRQINHHCDRPLCVNPEHLYLGTSKDNAQDRERRGRGHHPPQLTHCKRGHPYDKENTVVYVNGKGRTRRYCKACSVLRNAEWNAKRRKENA